MAFELIENMWLWFIQEIIGHEIIGSIVLFSIIFAVLLAINLPPRVAIAFMIPVSLGFIANAYLSWFGWLIIGFAGLMFGLIVYTIYER